MSHSKHTVLWEELEAIPKAVPDMGTCKLYTQALGLTKMVMVVCKFEPGERLVPHHHKEPTEEIYYVARGKGTVYIRDEAVPVEQGMALSVSSGVPHYLVNTGEEILEMVFILAPPQDQMTIYET
jgi:mannose-6-phosphate isomerase-like protein (cupin superfamily)